MKRLIVILLALIFISPLYPGVLKKMSLEQLILSKGDQLVASLPTIPGWFDDYHYYEFIEGKLFKVNAKTGKSQVVMANTKSSKVNVNSLLMPLRPAERTPDFKKFLIIKDGTISLFLPESNKLTPMVKAMDLEDGKESHVDPNNAKFSPDGNSFAYTFKNNLYVYDIAGRRNIQLTSDGSEEILNGYASWVYYEEILGRRSRYRAFWWSPDSTRIAFMRFDQSQVPPFTLFRSAGDYGNLETLRYPKAGYPNPTVRFGIINITTQKTAWINFKDKNDHYLAFPNWNKSGSKIFFQWMNRGQDELKIFRYDLASQISTPIYHEKQIAWVNMFESEDFFLLKNDDLLIRTSKDGWFHIYYISTTGDIKQLTSGDWSVTAIEAVNEKKKRIYFSGRKEDSTETNLYSIDFSGNKLKKLTPFKGSHSVNVSPSGRYFVDTYSAIQTPNRMELRDYRGRLLRELGQVITPIFKDYAISKVKAKLFRVKTSDGFNLPVAWYLPPDFDKSKKYPVVLTIYGGPNSSIVANSFGSGYRRGLTKFFLAQEGIINVFVDHRGSGHFGKKGMDMMHRQLGKWEMFDYIEVVKYLKTLPFIDNDKIGISGHSYGGYVAAYALTHSADVFKYGIAGSPVTDWKLYDTVYTERFMDTPQENPEGYKCSSALSHVKKFNGFMRLTHGAMDDNVHPQNAMQLLTTILDEGKTVEFMLYPGNRHGIRDKKKFEYNKSNINFWMKHFFGRTIEK
jgi:dipeptidyl-peptidase 4